MKIDARLGRIRFGMQAAGFLALSAMVSAPAAASYIQTNLVSDLSGLAAFTDPNLVNPWGLSAGTTTAWWVSDNGTGVSTLYNGSSGQPFPQPTPLVVTIPPAPGSPPGTISTPTGQVFNGSADFELQPGAPARFLFATQDGTIAGWNPAANPTSALVKVDNSASAASYTGLALAGSFLYAANFAQGRIDVFDSSFAATTLPGGFTDPNLPAGYSPFNIQNLGGQLYVTYAQIANGDEVKGAGLGFVDVFDTNGSLVRRLATGGTLNAPWGLALAPSDFGEFSNALLVGNFGDGLINAFNPATGLLLGHLADALNSPIAIDGLWGIGFGNDGNAGPHNALFFTAGIKDEAHGLFGSLTATTPTTVAEPGTLGLMAGLVPLLLWNVRRRASGATSPEFTRPERSRTN